MGQLPPQEGDIHLHVVVLRLGVIPPDLHQQLLLCDHLTAVAQQKLHQVVLPAAETHLPSAAGQCERAPLQRQAAPGERRALLHLTAAAPQQRADAGQQLLRLKGLGEIVVRAAVQPVYPVVQTALGRQHQHGGGHVGRAQLLGHLKAVHPRQHHVQHHQIIDARQGVVQPAYAVMAHVGGVALPVQQLPQGVRQTDFILHDQKTHDTSSLLTAVPAAAPPSPAPAGTRWYHRSAWRNRCRPPAACPVSG